MEKVLTDATEIEVAEIQKAIDLEYRTESMTLPAPPKFQDPEADRISNLEREAILNPYNPKAIIDGEGTTAEEKRLRLLYGILPKNATKETKDSVGKHTVTTEVIDGQKVVVIESPDITVAEPKVVSVPEGVKVEVIEPVKFPDAPVVKADK